VNDPRRSVAQLMGEHSMSVLEVRSLLDQQLLLLAV
jgi:hypothetical protein